MSFAEAKHHYCVQLSSIHAAYVNNDPVNWVDPWGLNAQDKKQTAETGTWSVVTSFGKNVVEGSVDAVTNFVNTITTAYDTTKSVANMMYADGKTKTHEVYYNLTEFHFEGRDRKNINLPTYKEASEKFSEWIELPPELSIYHDNGFGKPEKKFVHNDGREVVFTADFSDDNSYQIYTDPKYKGTYNYISPSRPPKSITDVKGTMNFLISGAGHIITDVIPYYLVGEKNERNQ